MWRRRRRTAKSHSETWTRTDEQTLPCPFLEWPPVLAAVLSESLPNPLLDDEPVYSAPAKQAGILYIILSTGPIGLEKCNVDVKKLLAFTEPGRSSPKGGDSLAKPTLHLSASYPDIGHRAKLSCPLFREASAAPPHRIRRPSRHRSPFAVA